MCIHKLIVTMWYYTWKIIELCAQESDKKCEAKAHTKFFFPVSFPKKASQPVHQ